MSLCAIGATNLRTGSENEIYALKRIILRNRHILESYEEAQLGEKKERSVLEIAAAAGELEKHHSSHQAL